MRILSLNGARVALLAAAMASLLAGPAQAGAVRSMDFAQQLPSWLDDTSSGSVPIGFQLNFGGDWLQTINVNSEGLLSWGAYTHVAADFPAQSVIAPFHADVDLRQGGIVSYGQAMLDGLRVFGATWQDVAGHDGGGTNLFQVLLIERDDRAQGDFDIEFNFDRIAWDGTPVARSGWQTRSWNGLEYVTQRFELPGSALAGALLDDGASALTAGRLGSEVDGRYVFAVRGGQVDVPNTVPPAVPEPATAWLTLAGLGTLGLVRRRVCRPS